MTTKYTEMWEILVPCQYNDGKPVRTRHHREWDRQVRALTGGITIMKPAKGQWINDGKLYEERMIPVRIACNSLIMHEICEITLRHYKQIAVCAYQISERCLIVRAD